MKTSIQFPVALTVTLLGLPACGGVDGLEHIEFRSGDTSGSGTTFDGASTTFDGASTTFDGASTTFDGASTTFDGSSTTFDGSGTTFNGASTTIDGSSTTFGDSGGEGTPCGSNADCLPHLDCISNGYAAVCVDLEGGTGGVGTPCGSNADCLPQLDCISNGYAAVCVDLEGGTGGVGTQCSSNADCLPQLDCISNGYAAMCVDLTGSCEPYEICNGLDDDCDGKVDESYLCMPAPQAETIDGLLASCPSAAELDAIDEDFDIHFEYTDIDNDGTLDDPAPEGDDLRCRAIDGSRDLTQSQERTYQALRALRAVTFDAPLPFTDNRTVYDWLRRAIDGIRMRSDISFSFCCAPPLAMPGTYINLQNSANRAFYAHDRWDDDTGLGLFQLAQLIVHEARHAQGYYHIDGTNDVDLAYLGSWGVAYHYARALAFDSDPCFLRPSSPASPSDLYLKSARKYSRMLHNTSFNAEPTVPVNPPEPVTACASEP